MLDCTAYLLAAFQFSSTTNTAYFVVQLLTTSINLSPTYTVLVSGAGSTPMQSPPIACLHPCERGRPHSLSTIITPSPTSTICVSVWPVGRSHTSAEPASGTLASLFSHPLV